MNGTAAVHWHRLGVGPGMVMVPSLTYVATFRSPPPAQVIACDIEKICVHARVQSGSRAIVYVHYSGGVGILIKYCNY